MGREARWAAVCEVAESDTTERPTKIYFHYSAVLGSAVQQNELVIHTPRPLPSWTSLPPTHSSSHPSILSQITELNAVCYTADSHSVRFNSVTQSCPTLQPHGLHHIRPPCPSPTPGVYSNSCPSSQ